MKSLPFGTWRLCRLWVEKFPVTNAMRAEGWVIAEVTEANELMREKKFWTLVALAELTAVTLVRPEHDLAGRAVLRPLHTSSENDATVPGSSSVLHDHFPSRRFGLSLD